MLRTLVSILFGVDMTFGVLNFVAWSWLARQRFDIWFLFLSVFSTHLPDVDFIPYLLLRRRFRLVSHWPIGHHPFPLLLFVTAVSFIAATIWLPGRVGYTIALTTTGVLLHFVHDGTGRLGFPWLSPFLRTRFRFRRGQSIVVPQVEIDHWMSRFKTQDRSIAQEISGRTPSLTWAHFLIWGAAVFILIIFVMKAVPPDKSPQPEGVSADIYIHDRASGKIH
jgi:hypothetical protein